MKRRDFLRAAGMSPLATLLPKSKAAPVEAAPAGSAQQTQYLRGDSTWAAFVRVSVNGVTYDLPVKP